MPYRGGSPVHTGGVNQKCGPAGGTEESWEDGGAQSGTQSGGCRAGTCLGEDLKFSSLNPIHVGLGDPLSQGICWGRGAPKCLGAAQAALDCSGLTPYCHSNDSSGMRETK